MYLQEKELLKKLFETSPFTTDGLKNLENHALRLWAKFRHIENVANLMESTAAIENFSEKEKLIAFTAGQFHDIACINDIALTGKEYGPKHGERGAVITYGLLSRNYPSFNADETEAIATAIANHDSTTTKELQGFTKTLASLLRDCDKVDCYRRQATEPLENVFQKPLKFDSPARQEWALSCLAGKPMKYAEMENFNEELLLYLGWFFQLHNISAQKAAMPFFKTFAKRMLQISKDNKTILFVKQAIKKAKAITNPGQ